MLSNSMGLILADHGRVHLGDLTRLRALAAVPIFGRYRIIDFTLSNMVNSGITNVGVAAMTKYKSLLDHIGTGASWDLDRMNQGLHILPPYINSSFFDRESGDLTGLYEFVIRGKQEYVVICDSNFLIKTDFSGIVSKHVEAKADMTILYNQDGDRYGSPTFSLNLERGVLKDFLVDSLDSGTQKSAIGVLVISRDLLLHILSQSMSRGQAEFSIELLLKMYKQYKICGCEYKGNCLRINSISTYYKSSMALLDPQVRKSFFDLEAPIYTKVKNEAPAYYESGSYVSNAIVSDGCTIYGSVSDSILFRGVRVEKHTNLQNCIIFQDAIIGEGADLHHVILDKNTVVRPGVKLQGQPDYPVVIGKGAIV